MYWRRWGDALAEAGFAPNQLQGAYEREDLLEKYAALARQLQRLPVSADLRMNARNNPGFPAHTTFANQFGSKSELIKNLRAFCERRGGLEDVLRLCDQAQPGEEAELPTRATEIEGFVYLVKSGRFYKIGRSNSAGRRQYELGIQLPERVATVHVIRTDDPAGIEAYWHKRFDAKRQNGEWFKLSADDVAAFRRRKFM